jgi:undecaprenyl-diphosphatase
LAVAEYADEFYISKVRPTSVGPFPLWLQNWDLAGFVLINKQMAFPLLDAPMWLITHAGSTTFWLLVCILLWVKGRKRDAVLLAIGIVLGGLIFYPVKVLLPRARPYMTVEDARVLDVEGGGSFPSGHSKNGFTAAVILGDAWKRWRALFYVLAFLIGLSRIYVGVHWPSDVIVGSVVGWIIGRLVVRYEPSLVSALKTVGIYNIEAKGNEYSG